MPRSIAAVAGSWLLLCLVMSAAAQAAPADWQSLPYFNYRNHELYLVSDKSWHGAKQLVPITPLPAGQDPTWSRSGGPTRKPIWVRKCGQKKQTALLTKTFMAPGVPSTASLQIDFASYSHSIRSVEVLINNARVAQVKKARRVAFSAAALNAFKVGPNQITLRAKRAKLPARFKCNTKNDKVAYRQRNAVALDLFATFRTDLALTGVTGQTHKSYRRVDPGDEIRDTDPIAAINRGPSMSIQGALGVRMTAGAYLTVTGRLVEMPAPFAGCTETTVHPGKQFEWVCPYETLTSGATAAGKSIIQTKLAESDSLPVNYGTTSYTIEWRLLPGPASWANRVFNSPFYWDPYGNSGGVTPQSSNEGSWTVIYCGPNGTADDPNCAYATREGCDDPPPCHNYGSPAAGARRARAG